MSQLSGQPEVHYMTNALTAHTELPEAVVLNVFEQNKGAQFTKVSAELGLRVSQRLKNALLKDEMMPCGTSKSNCGLVMMVCSVIGIDGCSQQPTIEITIGCSTNNSKHAENYPQGCVETVGAALVKASEMYVAELVPSTD